MLNLNWVLSRNLKVTKNALVECDECGNQLSHMASVCPILRGFDRSTQHQVAAEHSLASLVVFPIIIYFAVILGGIYIGKFDTGHTFFNSALFDISILNWLYIPILLILGGVPVFKHAWWGGLEWCSIHEHCSHLCSQVCCTRACPFLAVLNDFSLYSQLTTNGRAQHRTTPRQFSEQKVKSTNFAVHIGSTNATVSFQMRLDEVRLSPEPYDA